MRQEARHRRRRRTTLRPLAERTKRRIVRAIVAVTKPPSDERRVHSTDRRANNTPTKRCAEACCKQASTRAWIEAAASGDEPGRALTAPVLKC